MKFSGHDTFSCRTAWLYKGLELIYKSDNQKNTGNQLSVFNNPNSTIELGLGKNMVSAVKHWILSFGLYDTEEEEITELASLIYGDLGDDIADPFIEDPFTLWILHHELCSRGYATIYGYFFKEFFKRKSTATFSETDFLSSLKSWIKEQGVKTPSLNSLKSDFRCLMDMYCLKNSKAGLEESYSALLIDLNLINQTVFKTPEKEVVYEINQHSCTDEHISLYATLLIKAFGKNVSVSFDRAYTELGSILLLTRDEFTSKVEQVTQEYSNKFSFKSDAGISEIQINTSLDFIDFAHSFYYNTTIES